MGARRKIFSAPVLLPQRERLLRNNQEPAEMLMQGKGKAEWVLAGVGWWGGGPEYEVQLYEHFTNPLNTYIHLDEIRSRCSYSCTYKNIDTFSCLFSFFLPLFNMGDVGVIKSETCLLHAEYQDKIKSTKERPVTFPRVRYSITSLLEAFSTYNHVFSRTG